MVVAGAGGFIGGHLVADLLRTGAQVRAVDVKPLSQWHQSFATAENLQLDLSLRAACEQAAEGASEIYNLAADMGGIGFIEGHKAECMLSVLISTHMLMAAKKMGAKRYFYSSSACVYAGDKQRSADSAALKESDAYPADPEDGYGWEKLFSERMCRHFAEDFGLVTRVARYHNVFGPNGTWSGGREKAPAAICRKVLEAKLSGDHRIEIWGDGQQTRSFMYIDDCVVGTRKIMGSDVGEPINLGSSEMVTINQLVDIAEDIAGIKLERRCDLSAPKGVAGRNSDNTRIEELLGWAPSIRLRDGMQKTFAWIQTEMVAGAPPVLLLGWPAAAPPARMAEYLLCLRRNLECSAIGSVVAFCEGALPPLQHPKLKILRLGRRETFGDLMRYAGSELRGRTVVIANADIFFDETLRLARPGAGQLFALSRWDETPHGPRPFDRIDAQDAWIFKAPLPPGVPEAASFFVGMHGCDNRLAYEAEKAGLQVCNPSRSIIAHHVHAGPPGHGRQMIPAPYRCVRPMALGEAVPALVDPAARRTA